jgi:heptosyltransferase-2
VPELIVRLPNWVGDVCKSLPTLAALHRSGFRLHLAGRAWIGDLLAGLDQPLVPVGKGVIGPARALRATACKDGLLLTTSFGTAAAARLAGVRTVGFREDYRNWLLHRAIDYPRGLHEVDALLFLGRLALETFQPAAEWPADISTTPALPLTEAHRAEASQALQDARIDGAFIVLCPMATGTRGGLSKVWPHWRELSRRLAADGRRIVVCPGPGEEDACATAVPEATLLGGLGLGAYAAVCARAERVFANDSGPLHLAAAVGSRVLGIYGLAVRDDSRPRGADFVGSADGWPEVEEVLGTATG